MHSLLPELLDLSDLNPHLLERLADIVSRVPVQSLRWPKLEELLKENLRLLDETYPNNPDLQIRDEQFHVSRLEKLLVPKSVRELKVMTGRMIQKRHLSDVLLETHAWTGFMKAFTRLTTGRKVTEVDVREQVTLLACVIAEGCNIGLSDMALACPGLTYDQLEEV